MDDVKMEDAANGASNGTSVDKSSNGNIAPDMQQGSTTEEAAWDEERIEASQKALKEMYAQLRDLRTTIPRLIAPLTIKQPSPKALFQQLSASAATANAEVKQFRLLVESEESKKIFEHAKESRASNPRGIKPWRITEDADWFRKDL